MKKFKYIMIFMLVSMVALTGCGKKNSLSPSESVKQAKEKMEKLDNYNMKAELIVGIASGDVSMDIKVNMDGSVDVKNKKSYVKTSMDLLGNSQESEAYSTEVDGIVTTYSKDNDGNWTLSTSETNSTSDITNSALAILTNGEKLKELKADDKNYNYQINISVDELKKLAGNTDDSLNLLDGVDLSGDLVVKFSIDKENGYYTKMSIDMKDLLKNVTKDLGEEASSLQISKAEFNFEFLDFNKAKAIEIPAEALETDSKIDNNSGNVVDLDSSDVKCTLEEDGSKSTMSASITDGYVSIINMSQIEEFETEEDANTALEEFNSFADTFYSITGVNASARSEGTKVIVDMSIDLTKADSDFLTTEFGSEKITKEDFVNMAEEESYVCE